MSPRRRTERAKRDEAVAVETLLMRRATRSIYGAKKVWQQLKREEFKVARRTVDRLVRLAGLEGVARGKGCAPLSRRIWPAISHWTWSNAPAEPPYRTDSGLGNEGDAYDNAMPESVIGLFKMEGSRHAGPWQGIDDVEFATLEWVHWFKDERPVAFSRPATVAA